MQPFVYYFYPVENTASYTPELWFNEDRAFVISPLESIIIIICDSDQNTNQSDMSKICFSNGSFYLKSPPYKMCIKITNTSQTKRLLCRKDCSLLQLLRNPDVVYKIMPVKIQKMIKLEKKARMTAFLRLGSKF
jgi:hypothetical protein